MRREVEEFLKQHQTRETETARQRRAAHLISLGFFEIQYPQEGESENDYPDFEEGGRCRRVPLELTEEEYAAVCAAVPPERVEKKSWPIWPVQKILFVLAMIFYGVAIIFILFAFANASGFGAGAALASSVLGGVIYVTIGTLLLAVAEIVRLMKKRAGEE